MSSSCKSGGSKPPVPKDETTGLCPYLGEGDNCSFHDRCSEQVTSSTGVSVPRPKQITDSLKLLEGPPSLDEPLGEVFRTAREALRIVRRADTSTSKGNNDPQTREAWAYWGDPDRIEWDMGRLSSMYGSASVQAAALRAASKRNHSALKHWRAAKEEAMREAHKGPGRLTETALARALELDLEHRSLANDVEDVELALDLVDTAMAAIDKHIQVLKKRRETLAIEGRHVRSTS